MYTTSVSNLISSLSLALNHHLYADDTQPFLSFRSPDFRCSITLLQMFVQQISSWLTAYRLSAMAVLIGQKQQLAKIQNSWLCTLHTTRNLGFVFDKHLNFSDQSSSLFRIHFISPSSPVFSWFASSHVTSTPSLSPLSNHSSLRHSFIPDSIHSSFTNPSLHRSLLHSGLT